MAYLRGYIKPIKWDQEKSEFGISNCHGRDEPWVLSPVVHTNTVFVFEGLYITTGTGISCHFP